MRSPAGRRRRRPHAGEAASVPRPARRSRCWNLPRSSRRSRPRRDPGGLAPGRWSLTLTGWKRSSPSGGRSSSRRFVAVIMPPGHSGWSPRSIRGHSRASGSNLSRHAPAALPSKASSARSHRQPDRRAAASKATPGGVSHRSQGRGAVVPRRPTADAGTLNA